MKKGFIAITVAYIVGISSFVAQWQSDFIETLKGLRVFAVSLCIFLFFYAINVTANKKVTIIAIPSIILAGWGGFKIVFLVVVITLPVVIGGRAP